MALPGERPSGSGGGRFVILGAGAVGSYLGRALESGGARLAIADVDPAVRATWAERGVAVIEPAAGREAARWVEGDVVVLATKATVAAAALAPVPEGVPVIAITNGMLEAGDLRPKGPLAWGVVDFAASLAAPGQAVCTQRGGLTLGREGAGDATRRLAEALAESPISARLISDIDGYRWSKLVLNASFDPIATLTGQTFGQVFAHRPSRRALRRLLAEGVAVARAAGVDLHRVHGTRPSTLARVLGVPLLSEVAARAGARRARRIESALLADLRRGAPTEVDFLNGHIVRTAERLGIAAPTHRRTWEMIHDLERSGDPPGLERAAGLLS